MRLFLILINLSFLVLFLFSFNRSAFAAEIVTTQNPSPFTINDNRITITVQTKDGSAYFLGSKYSFVAWKGNTFDKNSSCSQGNIDLDGNASVNNLQWSKSKATASFSIVGGGCNSIGLVWHFRLWAGNGWRDMASQNDVVSDYAFTIAQSNGNLVTITAKNPIVYSGEKPTVILSNSVAGDNYSFYWDGNRNIARHFPEGNDQPGQLEVVISNFPTNETSHKLCMLYGSYLAVPIWIDCNPFVNFDFKLSEPRPVPSGPLEGKCTIIPSITPPLNSDVDIKIENLPSGTKVAAYVIDSNGKQFSTSHGIIDNTNSVTLNLIKSVSSAGSYTAVTYNEADGKGGCPDLKFDVSPKAAAAPPTVVNCTDTGTCTFSGGVTCNAGEGQAIKTAIGCISTSPTELIKDLLTFIIAISGGIAFLMMLLGAFGMLTSAGNPESLNAGRERLTSAIIGLLFVIFAVLIMQIIGVGFLALPNFH